MRIYKKAYPILIVIGALLLLLNIIFFKAEIHFAIRLILPFFSILLYVFIVAFFRIPKRDFSPDERLVYSPADGSVVAIEEVFEDEFLHAKCKKISVFMLVFNVHQNRVPVSGTVIYSKHHPGKYLVAWHPKSSLKNERNTVVIETSGGQQFLIWQIAGLVARRIICNVNEGDVLKQGDELGFIMFGSRVDVFVPVHTKINVKLKQKVKVNRHAIAEIG